MCYDRTSAGKRPMCATVCPSGALFFGKRDDIDKQRPHSAPSNRFRFGKQLITTRVHMMTPRSRRPDHLDVTAAMHDSPIGPLSRVPLHLLTEALFEEDVR
jgi:Fe-S-cluster-containing dehydrogenase component